MAANLEIKASLADREFALAQALRMGARYEATLHQVDVYFNVEHGRLKLRSIDGRAAELIYYDRDESSRQWKSKYERCRAADAEQLRHILESAYGVRGVVEKKRTLWMYHDTRIHFDEVKDLGSFMEIEVPVSEHAHLAEQTMTLLLAGFLIAPSAYCAASYIDLLSREKGGAKP